VHEAAKAWLWALGVVDQFCPAGCIIHFSWLGDGERRTHLIVSEGVTAKTASVKPAPNPARRLRGALTFPLIPPVVSSNKD
jgi:hypothetical protein